jgi:hypothetical protein
MAAPYALLETQALQQSAQIVKTDGRIGGTAEKAFQRFLSSHNAILHGVFTGRPSAVTWPINARPVDVASQHGNPA